MNKSNKTANRIIALAFFHRYGWIAVMLICIAVLPEKMLCILGTGFIVDAIWSFVGYKLKWRHVYCSYQNAHRKNMTPHSIRWHLIKKSDAYGAPLISLIIGLACLCIEVLYG